MQERLRGLKEVVPVGGCVLHKTNEIVLRRQKKMRIKNIKVSCAYYVCILQMPLVGTLAFYPLFLGMQ